MHHRNLSSSILQWVTGVFLIILTSTQLGIAQPTKKNQLQDTVFFLANKKGILGKIGRSLSVYEPEIILPRRGPIKNETPFAVYKGKIIRNIIITQLGLYGSVNDTLNDSRNRKRILGDALHTATKEKVIQKNIFFSSGDSVYPYLLADNERFLRNISYLTDARIAVGALKNNPDSVDIFIITKDLFPIGGAIDAGNSQSIHFEISDDNLLGRGDRLQIRNYVDFNRKPDYGIGIEYTKRNLGGSFTDVTIGYDNQKESFISGQRNEKAIYLRADLPLVSPYHPLVGSLLIGNFSTHDVYPQDTMYSRFNQYQYDLVDGWIGWNMGASNKLQENFSSRTKRILSARIVQRNFSKRPILYEQQYDIRFSDLLSVLASYTIFNQDFYHTNYIYGFGRNEDVPEGYSLSFTGGWSERNGKSRPYGGFDYQRNYYTQQNKYLNYQLKIGSSFNNGSFQDVCVLTSLEHFTKLKRISNGQWFIRHFLNASFTQLLNTSLNEPLQLSSDFGIPNINNTQQPNTTRATLNGETVFYSNWKLAGFRFAPFSFLYLTYLKTLGAPLSDGAYYSAIGAGLRSRNENLVFGTMELKAYYYPQFPGIMNPWFISFNTQVRFRYNTQLIKKPDFITAN
ncbi:MAG: hypothetical protein WCH59_08995 [Chitinophagia bacterium]|jgi:hypothetical protein